MAFGLAKQVFARDNVNPVLLESTRICQFTGSKTVIDDLQSFEQNTSFSLPVIYKLTS